MEENQLIGVYIKRIDFLEQGLFICEPSVEGFLYDKVAETNIKADSSPSNIFSYKCPYTLPKQEVNIRSNDWNQLLVINSNFSDLNSASKIFFFEICKAIQNQKNQDIDKIRAAWAFLVPLASDGSMNTNKELKLQLYKIRKKCKTSHQDCNLYHLYSEHKLKKEFGSLLISVKGIVPDKKPMKSYEEKEDTIQKSKNEEKLTDETLPTLTSSSNSWEWSRLPLQTCKVPNKIHITKSLGKNGSSCVQFSRKGLHVAVSVLSQIIIYETISGEEVTILKSHLGFIYELDWSLDDQYLLSVSNDCRAAIWCIDQKTPLFALPHPSYVYCGKWFENNEQIITGGRDHLVRFWHRKGNNFDLVEEMPGHSGFVSALAVQDKLVFSGDSNGCIIIRKHTQNSWVLLKHLTFTEIPQNVIDTIHTHSSSRRIIISVRSKGSYLIDMSSGVVLQSYKSAINTLARSISCLTPCGSLLFSFCQNGDVKVWEVNTGKLYASYDNLFSINRVSELSGSIHYHPYEHMVGITTLGPNCLLLLLKYDFSKENDSEKLGLTFFSESKKNNFNSFMSNTLISSPVKTS